VLELSGGAALTVAIVGLAESVDAFRPVVVVGTALAAPFWWLSKQVWEPDREHPVLPIDERRELARVGGAVVGGTLWVILALSGVAHVRKRRSATLRFDHVVPLAVEGVAGQVDRGQLGV